MIKKLLDKYWPTWFEWCFGRPQNSDQPGSRQVVSQRDIDKDRLMNLGRRCAFLITDNPKDAILIQTPSDALNAVEGVMVLARARKVQQETEDFVNSIP